MRLWHKNLIPVLPKQQLLGQWRECCAIVRKIPVYGSPNHILVNRIMDYPLSHFYCYGELVQIEMENRGYTCDFDKFSHFFTYPHETKLISFNEIFANWHNGRYFLQCYFNLQEKYDCGSISKEEWQIIIKEASKYNESPCNFIKA